MGRKKKNKRRKEIMYQTWRRSVNRILDKVIFQRKSICWAIGLIRQLSAELKIDGKLPSDDSLSIQELVLYVHKYLLKENDFEINQLVHAEEALKEYGTVSESLSPLDYNFHHIRYFDADVPRYKIAGMTVHDSKDSPSFLHFEKMLENALKKSPVAASIYVHDSYNRIKGKSIYNPGENDKQHGFHTMLLVGHGIDRYGNAFWEFQDSYGKRWGDKGFIRVAKGRGIIREFVEFKFP